jgi:hypothetical protein
MNHGEFALEIHLRPRLTADRRDHDRLAVADHGGRVLHEYQRALRRRAAHLGGVLCVVAADGEDGGGESAMHGRGLREERREYAAKPVSLWQVTGYVLVVVHGEARRT